jgi:hypothetical protein
MSKTPSFIQLCVEGRVLMDEIDDFIDIWHEDPQDLSLHEFLGMAWKEYSLWVSEPDILPYIITAHKNSQTIDDCLEQTYNLPIAARAGSVKSAKKLLRWLEEHGIAS